RSIFRDDRSGRGEIEQIVHSKAHDVDLRMMVVAQLPAGVGAINSAAGEIDIEILKLRRPMRREQPLDAAASRPAGAGVAPLEGGHAAVSEAAGAVEQQGRGDEIAGAAAHGAEPRQTEIASIAGHERREQAGGRARIGALIQASVIALVAAGDAGALEVRLGADHEGIELEVIANLTAADDAAGVTGGGAA